MKIEVGKKYKTKSSRKVVIYDVFDSPKGFNCVHGAVESFIGWCVAEWQLDGTYITLNKYLNTLNENLNLVEVKEDWEIAKELLEKRYTVLIKDFDDIFPIVGLNEDSEKYVEIKDSIHFETSVMLKKRFKLATKEEVIEYFFGGENEN
jgi:hypothetical protein